MAANAKPASGTSAPSKSPTLTNSPLSQSPASTTLTTPLTERTFDLPRDVGRYISGMRHISVSPYDGIALLSAGSSSALADLSTGQILRQFHDLPAASRCDLWIAQGKFVSVAEDNTVYTWETSRNASIAATFLKDTCRVNSCAVSQDGGLMAVSRDIGGIDIARTLPELAVVGHIDLHVKQLAFTDSALVAVSDQEYEGGPDRLISISPTDLSYQEVNAPPLGKVEYVSCANGVCATSNDKGSVALTEITSGRSLGSLQFSRVDGVAYGSGDLVVAEGSVLHFINGVDLQEWRSEDTHNLVEALTLLDGGIVFINYDKIDVRTVAK